MIRTSSRIHDALMQEFQDRTRVGPKSSNRRSTSNGSRVDHGHRDNDRMDEQGLILPKKLTNPCLESKEVMDLNREIKWNNKTGVNVLASKSELERAMDKRRWQQQMEGKQREKEEAKTDLQRAIDQRAKKAEEREIADDYSRGKSSGPAQQQSQQNRHVQLTRQQQQQQPEFLKVHAHLRHATSATDKT